jgi:hypothetical protein
MNKVSESNQNVKKSFLNVISENIPQDLKNLPQWVNWRGIWKPDKGKWDKVPFQPNYHTKELNSANILKRQKPTPLREGIGLNRNLLLFKE